MTTPKISINGKSSGAELNVFSYPNGSCLPPSPEEIAMIPPEYMDVDALMRRRMLLRVPTWIFSVCSIYIVIMLTLDTNRRAKKDKAKGRYVAFLKYGLLFAACITAVNLIFCSVVIFIRASGDANCNTVYRAENVLYWINISAIYLVLWLRQRAIYQQRGLRETVSQAASFFSYFTVVLVIVLPIANSVIFSVVMDFCYDEVMRLCRITAAMEERRFAIYIGEIPVPIILPLTLLCLFAWPLIRYQYDSKKAVKGRRSVVRILQRISIATAICLLTDIGTMICNGKCEVFVSPTFRHFSVFCNLLCLIVSFADWRIMLFPMVAKPSERTPSSTGTTAKSSSS